MLRLVVLLGLISVSAVACKESVATFVFEALIVGGQNGNPAAGTDATTLRIGIQEGELPAQEYEYPISDGDFEALLAFGAFTQPTRVRIGIEGPSTELLSAPPAFIPVASSGLLRVVAAAPSSCERVTFNLLEAPRAFFAMVQSGTFALIVGGTGATDEQIEFFDALEWESRLFVEQFAVGELGETRAASVDEAEILVLPGNTNPFIFNMADAARRITPVFLHRGAGPSSALVSLPGVGAMVIGGDDMGAPQSDVSLVEPGGVVTSLRLSEPRSGAAATALGTDVLVVGGNVEGSAELLLDVRERSPASWMVCATAVFSWAMAKAGPYGSEAWTPGTRYARTACASTPARATVRRAQDPSGPLHASTRFSQPIALWSLAAMTRLW